MEITSIKNKHVHSNMDVCPQYLHKEIDMTKSIIKIGNPLVIVFETGSYFGHEEVVDIGRNQTSIRIETTNKIWMIS